MAENRKLPEIAKTVRLDFGGDDTRMKEVFGSTRITLSEMQNRLWTHIERKQILIDEGAENLQAG